MRTKLPLSLTALRLPDLCVSPRRQIYDCERVKGIEIYTYGKW